jgi:DNA-binding transcriptional MerR regulator
MTESRVLSNGDIAEETGLTPQRIWQLAITGGIPAQRANPGGKHYRFYDSALFAAWRKQKARQSARPRLSQVRRAYRLSYRPEEKSEKLLEILENQTEVSASGKKASRLSLIQKARGELRALYASELRLKENYDEIMRHAWMIGSYLFELKGKVGHGNWLIWLPANLPELGSTNRARQANAARCIKFYRDNPNCRNSCNFTPESRRKFMWGYIPAKERLLLPGDEKSPRLYHYLTFVNYFWMWDHRVRIGKYDAPDLETLRREVELVVRRLIELCGRKWTEKLCRETDNLL